MQAFHGNKAIKAKYVARVLQHRKLDNIVQGQGWSSGKGCAVGCTLEEYNHNRYPTELGIPIQIAYLEDRLFELSTVGDARKWPGQFLKAIPVGADLSKVWGEWAQWMLVSADFGILQHARTEEARVAIEHVAELYRIGGTAEQFRLAAAAAAAAYGAAYAAAAAASTYASTYAASAAAAAAYAAAHAAASAAADRAAAAAGREVRNIWVVAARSKLLELLREAK